MKRTLPSLAVLFLAVSPAAAQLYVPTVDSPGYYPSPRVPAFARNHSWLASNSRLPMAGPAWSHPALPSAPWAYPYPVLPYYAYSPAMSYDTSATPFDYGPRRSNDVFYSEPYVGGESMPRATPAEPALAPGTAMVTLSVRPDAEVLVQGQTTTQTGAVRSFVTPALSGPTTYAMTVKWMENGQSVERPINVEVKPGDRKSVLLLR